MLHKYSTTITIFINFFHCQQTLQKVVQLKELHSVVILMGDHCWINNTNSKSQNFIVFNIQDTYCLCYVDKKIKKPSVLWRCWLGGKKGIWPVKTEWWDAGMVICLWRGVDLHMAQLMPLPLTISCACKSRLVLPFWYGLTRVIPDKRPLNSCCCCSL